MTAARFRFSLPSRKVLCTPELGGTGMSQGGPPTVSRVWGGGVGTQQSHGLGQVPLPPGASVILLMNRGLD